MRLVEILRDLFAAGRVAGQEYLAADVAFFDMQVECLTFFVFHE
jgi:hypothetical protein